MKKILSALALAISFAFAGGASARQVSKFPSVSLAGASSNASSAVATSSINLPTIAFMFGYNGASWDQLQVDGSKFLNFNMPQIGDVFEMTEEYENNRYVQVKRPADDGSKRAIFYCAAADQFVEESA